MSNPGLEGGGIGGEVRGLGGEVEEYVVSWGDALSREGGGAL